MPQFEIYAADSTCLSPEYPEMLTAMSLKDQLIRMQKSMWHASPLYVDPKHIESKFAFFFGNFACQQRFGLFARIALRPDADLVIPAKPVKRS